MLRSILSVFIVCILLISCSEVDSPVTSNSEDNSDTLDTIDTVIIVPDGILSSDFESGSIGKVNHISDVEWELYLANDNENSSLPKSWRNWFYVKMDNLNSDTLTAITLKNRGWPYYYLPVYSYDNENWVQFDESEVSQNSNNKLVISKAFSDKTVWIARFYPYTFSDLETYIETIDGKANIDIEIAGESTLENPIYLFKIIDTETPQINKERVIIHARTHPAEIPSSFVIEGLVNFLLGGSSEAVTILEKYEFYIFPMQNVDGVIAGNYRSTPQSENLEVMWNYDSENPINLLESTPPEVKTIHEYAKKLMTDGGPAVSIALNLHSANSEKDIRPFFFPHFGDESQGYSESESSLWNKQLSFIGSLAEQIGTEMLEPIPTEGGSSFAQKTYPESWWWINFQDSVMAITMETTYGRAGFDPNWVTPKNFRDLGYSLAIAIGNYNSSDEITQNAIYQRSSTQSVQLEFPELYPPLAIDELKE